MHKNTTDTIKKRSGGFTIIEIIIVLAVLAILVTIGVVGYENWQESTNVTQLKSDLNGVAAAMETARNFGNSYPASVPSTFKASNGTTTLAGGSGDGKTYCVSATNSNFSGVYYHIDPSESAEPTIGQCLANPVVGLLATGWTGIYTNPVKYVNLTVTLPPTINVNQCTYKVEKPSYSIAFSPLNPTYGIYETNNGPLTSTNKLIYTYGSSDPIWAWNDKSDPSGLWTYHYILRATVSCDYYNIGKYKVGTVTLDALGTD